MSRLMSVAFTEAQVRDRSKTVTRRMNWWENKRGARLLVPGDRLTLCRKVMGRKPNEPLHRLVDVQVYSVRREPLIRLISDQTYGRLEMAREGFPGMDPAEFIRRFFEEAQRIHRHSIVTRIEWRYLDTREDACLKGPGCDGTSHSLPCNNAWFGRTA